MGLVDQINQHTSQLSARTKMGVQNLSLLLCKLISALILGLTCSLVAQEIFQYGQILFFFVIMATTATFMKLSSQWSYIGLLIFDLLCILGALLIRMYVVVAPG